MIIVKSGRVVQWLDQDSRELGPGDSVYIDKDVVHGSFNEFGETAELQVILAPASAKAATSSSTSRARSPGRSLRS